MARLGPEQLEAHAEYPIRDRAKLQTIPHNARFILDIRQEQGYQFWRIHRRLARHQHHWPVAPAGRARRAPGRALGGRVPAPGQHGTPSC